MRDNQRSCRGEAIDVEALLFCRLWQKYIGLFAQRNYRRLPPAKRGEGGFALLMTLFLISLAAIVVAETVNLTLFDSRASRGFIESIQSDYVLKSGLNLGKLVLEIPKADGINEDWLGDPWAIIGQAPSLPIDGLIGSPRLAIVDNSAKLNLASLSRTGQGGYGSPSGSDPEMTGGMRSGSFQSDASAAFWKKVARNLFEALGIKREDYDEGSYQTPGGVGLEASLLPSVIDDWTDTDSESFSSDNYETGGIESFAPNEYFFNRPLQTLTDILNVPGFSSERMKKLAPFVTVVKQGVRTRNTVNINTASPELLASMGLAVTDIEELMSQRLNLPINQSMLSTILGQYQDLTPYLDVKSRSFSILVKADLPNRTRWLEAQVSLPDGVGPRTPKVTSIVYR